MRLASAIHLPPPPALFASLLALALASARVAGGGVNIPAVPPQPSFVPPVDKGDDTGDLGDPVNALAGVAWTRATDLDIPAPGFSLTLRRAWHSRLAAVDGPFGAGWTHTLDPRIVMDADDFGNLWAVFSRGDGTFVRFLHGRFNRSGGSSHNDSGSFQFDYTSVHTYYNTMRPWGATSDADLTLARTAGGWRLEAPGLRRAEFRADGLAAELRDDGGNAVTFVRDDAGRLLCARHSRGQEIGFEYDGDSQLIRRAYIPARQLQMLYSYHAIAIDTLPGQSTEKQLLLSAQRTSSSGGSAHRYAYDETGLLIQRTTPSGTVFHHAYVDVPALNPADPPLRLVQSARGEPGGLYEYTLTYPSATSTVARAVREDGAFETLFIKNAVTDRPLAITRPSGERREFRYDPAVGLPAGVVLSSKASGTYAEAVLERDSDGRIVAERSAFNAPAASAPAWRIAYDADCGLPGGLTDPCGRQFSAVYDSAGRLSSTRAAVRPGDWLSDSFVYDGAGHLSEYRDPCGRAARFRHDFGGYLTNAVHGTAPAAAFGWDPLLGLLTNITLPGPGGVPRTVALRRDELGRTSRVDLPGGGAGHFEHDASGRLVSATDPAGRRTRLAWHPGGRLAGLTRDADGLAAAIGFDYNRQMDALRITDPLGREVERYALDGDGRATNVWDIEGRPMAIRYALGGLVGGIDRFDGSTVGFGYDSGGYPGRLVYPDGELHFSHLPCGRLETASNAVSHIVWSYDGAGRPTGETCAIPGLSSSLSEALDDSGLATNTTLSVESWALNVERSFDPAARLATQTTEAGAFAWSYTPWNGLPAAVANLDSGLSASYEYDALDRPVSIVWRNSEGDILRAFSYLYDMVGSITNVVMEGGEPPSRAVAYGYDTLGRLTAETAPARANAWFYDLAGNRTNAVHNGTSTAYTLGIGDRLAATSGGAAYRYDAAGCVTNISSVVPVPSVASLSWNSRYQLASVYTNGAPAESYQYDALGRRVATTSGGATTYHVYDGGWQVLADLDADGLPLRSYAWGPGIDNLLAMTVYTEAATNTYYAITDRLGTVHALADASGAVAESYEFDAWGNVLGVYDASGSPIGNRQSAIGNRYLWQGREYSYATGLYHFRHRWYDPATGRWLSNDPIGISGGLNQYVFCGNDPVIFTDAFGLAELTCSDKAMLAIVDRYFPQAFENQTEMTGYIRKNPKTGKCEEGVSKEYPWSPNRAITVGTKMNAPPPPLFTVPDASAVWHFHVMPRDEDSSQGLSQGDRGWARDIKRWTGGRIEAWYLAVPSGQNINIYRWDIQKYYHGNDMIHIGTRPLSGGRR